MIIYTKLTHLPERSLILKELKQVTSVAITSLSRTDQDLLTLYRKKLTGPLISLNETFSVNEFKVVDISICRPITTKKVNRGLEYRHINSNYDTELASARILETVCQCNEDIFSEKENIYIKECIDE